MHPIEKVPRMIGSPIDSAHERLKHACARAHSTSTAAAPSGHPRILRSAHQYGTMQDTVPEIPSSVDLPASSALLFRHQSQHSKQTIVMFIFGCSIKKPLTGRPRISNGSSAEGTLSLRLFIYQNLAEGTLSPRLNNRHG